MIVIGIPGGHVDGRRVVALQHEPPVFRDRVNGPADGVHAAPGNPLFRCVDEQRRCSRVVDAFKRAKEPDARVVVAVKRVVDIRNCAADGSARLVQQEK
ncbi:hypothetical protein SDC9_97751 [bioreactor metagenome]|uniref:Uncharacterized protein n=1 Tax=bioreactor metagenome TaxID=1076179 RepID=A0A645ACR8_9ZZZZ